MNHKLEAVNICIFIRTLMSGGAEKQSILLAKALNDKYSVFLIVQKGEHIDRKNFELVQNNKLQYVLLSGNLWKRMSTFCRFLRQKEINIIFSYLTSDNFWSAIIGTLAGVNFLIGGIRSITLPWYKHIITKQLHRFFLDFIIFNSHTGYNEFIRKGFIEGKSLVIHNYAEIKSSQIIREGKNIIRIITVGRFTYEKDYYTALRAFHFLLNQFIRDNAEIEYIIIGFGKLEAQIKHWIEELNLSKNVRLLNNPDNLADHYISSDIYLCSSIIEGLSNTIMEAMSYGLPVVATDAGDNKYLVVNEKTGFVVPVKDYNLLAKKMNVLIQSQEKRIEMGKQGYEHLKRNFSIKKFKDKYTYLINELMAKKFV